MSETKSEVVASVPQHIGFILDGNRRWARENGKPVVEGHRQGYLAFKRVVKSAIRHGVRYVSAYAFSTENWQRDRQEVRDLMKIFLWVCKHEVAELDREGIRLRVIGSKLKIGHALARAIHEAEEKTKNNTRGTMLLCLDYGGQQEIVEAMKQIVADGVDPDDITPELISQHLYAPDIPPPDLIVRTSGEKRLSNFMTWESTYSELAFVNEYFPDYNEASLQREIDDYGRRHRRFGGN